MKLTSHYEAWSVASHPQLQVLVAENLHGAGKTTQRDIQEGTLSLSEGAERHLQYGSFTQLVKELFLGLDNDGAS